MGLLNPTKGKALLCGIPVSDPASRNKVGYLPENPSFYDFLTAREYLTFVGNAFGMNIARIREETDRVLNLMDLQEATDRLIHSYSKGMVQRLGLAQVLLHDPDVYILDEPMSGLDPIGRALVKEIIRGLKERGKTVFFSTHITADVEAVCDRVGVIVGGKLQRIDRVETLLQSGIEGYHIQLKNMDMESGDFAAFTVRWKSQDVMEVYVPRDDLSEFIRRLDRAGGKIDLIEPKRKDLESFFLDIVSKGSK